VDRRTERDRRREVHQQELGRTVKELCEARNLTQQELADKIHRLRQFLTRLESGRDVKVTLDVIEDLADALEVQAGELLESFLSRSAMKRALWVTVPKTDPRLERHRKALSRLSRAAARVPVAEIETLAKWAEARAGTAKVAGENLVLGPLTPS
jgi:transcriptional regulator with XRE-family HTH domain